MWKIVCIYLNILLWCELICWNHNENNHRYPRHVLLALPQGETQMLRNIQQWKWGVTNCGHINLSFLVWGKTPAPPHLFLYSLSQEIIFIPFSQLKVSDPYSNYVCVPCWEQVDTFHKFFQQTVLIHSSEDDPFKTFKTENDLHSDFKMARDLGLFHWLPRAPEEFEENAVIDVDATPPLPNNAVVIIPGTSISTTTDTIRTPVANGHLMVRSNPKVTQVQQQILNSNNSTGTFCAIFKEKTNI